MKKVLLFFVAAMAVSAGDINLMTWDNQGLPVSSSSFGAWVDNGIAEGDSLSMSTGDPASPSFFNLNPPTAVIPVTTDFPSWNGSVGPSGAFAGENGNTVNFPMQVSGPMMSMGMDMDMGMMMMESSGEKVSLDKLSFSATSTTSVLDFSAPEGSLQYGTNFVGIDAGPDGLFYTPDDQFITSGPNTQQVDMIIAVGLSNEIDVACPGCTLVQEQNALNQAIGLLAGGSITGTYGYDDGSGGVSSSATATFGTATPELPTMLLVFSALLWFGLKLKRLFNS